MHFFFCGAAHGHAQEPTPGSAVKFWCARTNPWFRGRTLPVPGHRGGRVIARSTAATSAVDCNLDRRFRCCTRDPLRGMLPS